MRTNTENRSDSHTCTAFMGSKGGLKAADPGTWVAAQPPPKIEATRRQAGNLCSIVSLRQKPKICREKRRLCVLM